MKQIHVICERRLLGRFWNSIPIKLWAPPIGQIMKQIHTSKIKIYEFPDLEDAEENERKENKRMKDRVPFAVVGSNTGGPM